MFIRSIATTADVPLSASITSETALAARLIAFAIGEEPADISAIDVAELESGDDLAVGGGLGAFVRQYGSDVPVQLNAPVDGIEWHTPGCVTLSGSFGTLRARSCLITVPPGVLAADGAIRFDPALPDSKQVALQHLPMSSFVKVALRLTRPLTELPLYSVDAQRFEGGSLHALHHSPGSNIATLMLGGMAARELMDAGEAAAIAEARSVLAALVGADATAIVRDGLLCEWRSDAFARGAYAFVRPGTGTPRIDYAASIADRLFFAGDTAGGSLAMTVGGAYQSARDAATAIHRVLDR